MSHRGSSDLFEESQKSTDCHDGKVSEAVCEEFKLHVPTDKGTNEIIELKTSVKELESQMAIMNDALWEVVDYVRQKSEEKSRPVGCGFSCTNNSVSVG